MTHRVPLYEDYAAPRATIETVDRFDRDMLALKGTFGRDCEACSMSSGPSRNPCIGAFGAPGGLLVVGELPRVDDDLSGRPFSGHAGALVRKMVERYWSGPVAYDLAIRCRPPKTAVVKAKQVDACRGFLAQTIDEVAPTRIICLGSLAVEAVFGRSASFGAVGRGGVGWLRGDAVGGGRPIPAFFLQAPAVAMQNRFYRKLFEEDVERACTAELPLPPWDAEVTVVSTPKLAAFVHERVRASGWVSFDVETTGRMWTKGFEIISCALCTDIEDDVWLWDRAALSGTAATNPVLAELLRIMSGPVPKVGQNVKYDQLAFRSRYGIHVGPIHADTRLQRKLLEPEASASLEHMTELVGLGGAKGEADDILTDIKTRVRGALRKDGAKRDAAFEKLGLPPAVEAAVRLGGAASIGSLMYGLLPDDVLWRYNARDALATQRLAKYMEQDMRSEDLRRTWQEIVLPAARALVRVEEWGVPVSRAAVENFDRYLERREEATRAVLEQYGDKDMNWDSPVQIRELLFKKLALPPLHLTDTGLASTDGSVLEHLAKTTGHPLPSALVEYRFATKLRATYAQGMYEHIRPDDRIHPNVKLDGARSGRTSCVDPNLQNIPRPSTPEGKMARDCFVARPGFLLVEADYSQLELRVAAMLSQDLEMIAIFKSGVDYHLRTAQLVSEIAWGITPDQVTDEHRTKSKAVNFGVLYGKTAKTLADEWGVSRAKAETVVNAIMGRFKRLSKWCDAQLSSAQKTGEVWTEWEGRPARRRPLHRIADPNDGAASQARNGAVNTPIQGTASDFCIRSLTNCVGWIEDDGIEDDVKLILPVHDALLFEVRDTMVNEVSLQVNDIMTSHYSYGVPLVADFKVGRSWGSMSKLKPGEYGR